MATRLKDLAPIEVSLSSSPKNGERKFLLQKGGDAPVLLEKVIKHEDGKWVLYTADGARKLGSYDSEEAAVARERQVNHFQHVRNSMVEKAGPVAAVVDAWGKWAGTYTGCMKQLNGREGIKSPERTCSWLHKRKGECPTEKSLAEDPEAPTAEELNGLWGVMWEWLHAADDEAVKSFLDDLYPEGDIVLEEKAATKTEAGQEFPAAAYAYVPDPKTPSTWKLRLWESPADKVTAKQVGMAVAALGKGFRGNKVAIPAEDRAAVIARVKAAWHQANPDAKDAEMPPVLKGMVDWDEIFDDEAADWVDPDAAVGGEEEKAHRVQGTMSDENTDAKPKKGDKKPAAEDEEAEDPEEEAAESADDEEVEEEEEGKEGEGKKGKKPFPGAKAFEKKSDKSDSEDDDEEDKSKPFPGAKKPFKKKSVVTAKELVGAIEARAADKLNDGDYEGAQRVMLLSRNVRRLLPDGGFVVLDSTLTVPAVEGLGTFAHFDALGGEEFADDMAELRSLLEGNAAPSPLIVEGAVVSTSSVVPTTTITVTQSPTVANDQPVKSETVPVGVKEEDEGAAIVEAFAQVARSVIVNRTLGRTDKLAVLQEALNSFGASVVRLIEATTPMKESDMMETMKSMVAEEMTAFKDQVLKAVGEPRRADAVAVDADAPVSKSVRARPVPPQAPRTGPRKVADIVREEMTRGMTHYGY